MSPRRTRRRGWLLLTAPLFAACNAMGCPDILYPYVDQPRTLPAVAPLEALGVLSSARCGLCHQAIYEEWQGSLMAAAKTNPFFRQERAESKAAFLCGRCHHPLENQEPLLVDGLESLEPLVPRARPNPGYDPELSSEGVGCPVCHLSPHLAYWPERPPPELVRRGPAVAVLSARALPDAVPPHPLRVAPALEPHGRLCARCHQFDPVGTHVARPPLDTVREYQAYRAAGGTETCLGCHMPAVERRAAPSAPVRVGHDHRFRGARDGAFIAAHLGARLEVAPGGVVVELENRAGHHLPTGEPSRVLSVRATLWSGGVAGPSRWVRIYRDLETTEVVERFDASLKVGERRTIRVPFSEAELALAGQVRVQISMYRYEPDHPLVQAAGLGPEGLETPVLVLTASVAGSRPSP